jgi:phage-related protein
MTDSPWQVEYYKDAQGCQPVVDWLKSLDPKHRARVQWTITMLREFGFTLREPYCRHVRGKVWELRTSVGRLEHRVLYFAATGGVFVLLHGFTKKTGKTPSQEIMIAEMRAADWETSS